MRDPNPSNTLLSGEFPRMRALPGISFREHLEPATRFPRISRPEVVSENYAGSLGSEKASLQKDLFSVLTSEASDRGRLGLFG